MLQLGSGCTRFRRKRPRLIRVVVSCSDGQLFSCSSLATCSRCQSMDRRCVSAASSALDTSAIKLLRATCRMPGSVGLGDWQSWPAEVQWTAALILASFIVGSPVLRDTKMLDPMRPGPWLLDSWPRRYDPLLHSSTSVSSPLRIL